MNGPLVGIFCLDLQGQQCRVERDVDIGAFLLQSQKTDCVGRKCHNLWCRLDFAAGAKLSDQLLFHAAVGDADALPGQVFDVLDIHGLTVQHLDACRVVDQ